MTNYEPEDILPDYLAYIEITTLDRIKSQLLSQSQIIPKFYSIITEYKINNTFTTYKIEYGVMEPNGKQVHVCRTMTRYSKILELYNEVKSMFKSSKLPSFPAKRWLCNNTETLAKERLTQMNAFIQQLNLFPGVQELPTFKNIFKDFQT